ncbi:MAG: hypothetical protein H6634_17360 [Anaerolineales bacterium]|nr:hypothetical protein [Anaerolineales bacterium]MCB9113014.1 hypothetical protein [Anaerolineales bacterium]
MEVNPGPQTGPQKSNRNTIIIAVVAVLLCCCLIVVGIGGYYGYKAYVAAKQTVEDIQNLDIPTDIPFVPLDPNGTPVVPGFDTSGEVPSGGLADEQTRYIAWASVQVIGIISGCTTPTVDGTTITVIQEPDASGVWREEWNVNCGDGSYKPFPLTFTPENGTVNVSVDYQP